MRYRLYDYSIAKAENGWYVIGLLGHRKPPPGDDSPEDLGTCGEYASAEQALSAATKMASSALARKETKHAAVIDADGDEVFFA